MTNRTLRPVPRTVAALAAILTALAILGPTGKAAELRATGTSEGVLVVTANLQEAFGDQDVSDHSELRFFVERVLELAGRAPDVILVQDTRRSAARYVMDRLASSTGNTYAAGQRLPRLPGYKSADGTKWISVETAVLVNTTTMNMPSLGGFAKINNPWGDHVKYDELKSQAWVGLTHRASKTPLGFMSVHLPKPPTKDPDLAQNHARWVNQLARFMVGRFGTNGRIIGGDFNQTRCSSKDDPCNETPFWRQLTTDGYTETISTYQQSLHWTERVPLGVDFIWSTGTSSFGSGDPDRNQQYSNHRFFWSILDV